MLRRGGGENLRLRAFVLESGGHFLHGLLRRLGSRQPSSASADLLYYGLYKNPLPVGGGQEKCRVPKQGIANWGVAVLSLLALFPLATSGLAQEEQRAPDNPDASSPAQTESAPPQKPDTPLQTAVAILSERSIFFPELAVTPKPLTPKQKLELSVDESIAPSTALDSAVGAGIEQAWNWLPGYGQGWAGYGKRFGSSMASGASSNLFGTFLLPSLLKQDPRYFVLLHGSFSQRAMYAVSRSVITRTDHGGRAFNWSMLGGCLAAEILADSYLPPEERTAGRTLGRYGVRVGLETASNVLKEYWPSIFKRLRVP
jgi:hypothetical protein